MPDRRASQNRGQGKGIRGYVYERPLASSRRMTAMAREQEDGPDGHGHDPDRRGHEAQAQAQPEAPAHPR